MGRLSIRALATPSSRPPWPERPPACCWPTTGATSSTSERRGLGTATTGVRFVETLGSSVTAAGFAALFASVTAHCQFGPAHPMGALDVIFAVGAGLLAVATVVAIRRPAGQAPKPPGNSRVGS